MRALALAALLLGGAAEARFAPRVDVPYRLLRVQEHDDPRGRRRFDSERQVMFERSAGGYLARVSLTGTQDSGAGSDYALLTAAMNGQPVMVELDRDGHLRQVRDLDAIWARLRIAIGAAAVGDEARLALWRVHDAATTAQRAQAVAGVLLTALAPDDAERKGGERAVTLPSVGIAPAASMSGSERVAVRQGRVTIDTEAVAPGRRLTRRRSVDRRTGLLIEQQERQRSAAAAHGAPWQVEDQTTVSMTPVL